MFHPKGPTFFELAVQALSSTDRGYDLLAPKFDYTPFRTPEPVLRVAAKNIGPPASIDRALDLCCGTGAAMGFLRPLCRGAVVGVDRSRGMLVEASRRLAGAPGAAAISLVRGDALHLPFRAEFDVVTCFSAFGHILERDEPRLVASIASALKPGGRFVCATSDRISALRPSWWLACLFNGAMRVRNALHKPEFVMYYLTFLLPRATALLEAEGFEVEVLRGIFPRPYGRLVLLVATRR
jgi:ubiquinone/menaquinone biosynthesis C-methylase UbiE